MIPDGYLMVPDNWVVLPWWIYLMILISVFLFGLLVGITTSKENQPIDRSNNE